MAFKGHDWVRYNYKNFKGHIMSFEDYKCFDPTFKSEFNYYGERWGSIEEAYESFDVENMSTSAKLNLMGNILYYYFKQNKVAYEMLLSTDDLWIQPLVTNHDNFWFKCKCANCFFEEADNYYGRLLMEVRDYFIWERKRKYKGAKNWRKRYF